jgi:hypothetical protein
MYSFDIGRLDSLNATLAKDNEAVGSAYVLVVLVDAVKHCFVLNMPQCFNQHVESKKWI